MSKSKSPKTKNKKPTTKSQESKTKKSRPTTTLFLINSVDGRITSHDSDDLDPDKKWKHDPKIQALTQPFFDFASGNIHTVTYGEALADIGVNTRTSLGKRQDISLVVIDHPQHLTAQGVHYLCDNFNTIYLACLSSHPANKIKKAPKNLKLLTQKGRFSLKTVMKDLYQHQVKKVSIQSNANLNARWLSAGVIDHLSVIISPLLVGRHGTPNLIDQDLLYVKPLILTQMKAFGLDFVNLRYDVLN